LTAFYGGFKWSMQHLISNYREEDVENESKKKAFLHRGREVHDLGSLAKR
jgi:hypothetical protein